MTGFLRVQTLAGCTTTLLPEEEPLRYTVNVDSWLSRVNVMERCREDAVEHIGGELEGMHEGDQLVITIKCSRLSDAELDEMPEWHGP